MAEHSPKAKAGFPLEMMLSEKASQENNASTIVLSCLTEIRSAVCFSYSVVVVNGGVDRM